MYLGIRSCYAAIFLAITSRAVDARPADAETSPVEVLRPHGLVPRFAFDSMEIPGTGFFVISENVSSDALRAALVDFGSVANAKEPQNATAVPQLNAQNLTFSVLPLPLGESNTTLVPWGVAQMVLRALPGVYDRSFPSYSRGVTVLLQDHRGQAKYLALVQQSVLASPDPEPRELGSGPRRALKTFPDSGTKAYRSGDFRRGPYELDWSVQSRIQVPLGVALVAWQQFAAVIEKAYDLANTFPPHARQIMGVGAAIGTRMIVLRVPRNGRPLDGNQLEYAMHMVRELLGKLVLEQIVRLASPERPASDYEELVSTFTGKITGPRFRLEFILSKVGENLDATALAMRNGIWGPRPPRRDANELKRI
ncbi:MAG: hypothetical protein M1832_003531 [Thelocarpon impressellum]|nr:MAG: hypothetical protein M1832_003531 [Thelocarpon impressellum]